LKIAIKRLTRSDLTFFEYHFRTIGAGNQKSINLNANPFTKRLYPDLPAIAPRYDNELAVVLDIIGPGDRDAHRIARKIVKGGTYKNWRLNGEFVHGPEGDPDRYNGLMPDDMAVMAFHGDSQPERVSMFLLSSSEPSDRTLLDNLALRMAPGHRQSMIALTSAALAEVIDAAQPDPGHPIRGILTDPGLDPEVEDAALGGGEGIRSIGRRRRGRGLSASELERARAAANEIGEAGEQLIDEHLKRKQEAAEIRTYTWASRSNAVSPFDFIIDELPGTKTRLDVKSTAGEFSRKIHISITELETAAEPDIRYDIYRVFGVGEEGGALRISVNIGDFARSVLDGLAGLPRGVRPDGFSISPDALTWGPEIEVRAPEEEGGE